MRLAALGLTAALLATGLAVALDTTPAMAQTAGAIQIAVNEQAAENQVTLSGLGEVTIRTSADGREVHLQLGQPLGETTLAELPERLPEMIEDVRFGYDSMLLRVPEDVAVFVTKGPSEVTFSFQKISTGFVEYDRETARLMEERLRLEFLQALAMAEQGQVAEAHAELDHLAVENPRNIDILAGLAGVEDRIGRDKEAIDLYQLALAMAPNDADIARSLGQARRRHGSFVRTEVTYLDVDGQDEQIIASVSARQRVNEKWSLEFSFEDREVEIASVQRIDGTITAFDGNRQSGSVGFVYEPDSLTRMGARALINPDGVGAGLAIAFGPNQARNMVELAYNEPYFDLVEGIVDHAVRDRFTARHERDLAGDNLRGAFEVSYSRYGIGDDDEVATTGGVALELTYEIVSGEPAVTLAYELDAEYVFDADSRLDATGAAFRPLPITSREVHSLALGVGGESGDLIYFAEAGYAYDRLNDDGPFVGAEFSYAPHPQLVLGARARYAVTTGRGTADNSFEVGAFASVHF